MKLTDAVFHVRRKLASFDPSVAHTVSGHSRPQVSEIYAPEQHAGALDPHVPIVLGARGSGKSFWAGVLGNEETRNAAAASYPRLGLKHLEVKFGFIGQESEGAVSRQTIDTLVPDGHERKVAVLLWRSVVLRAVMAAVAPNDKPPKVKQIFTEYSDPEDWEEKCAELDKALFGSSRTVLVIFDALDALAEQHDRLEGLLDALLQVAWAMRSYKAIRLKLFLRDDQVSRLRLKFVELPKLISGATKLQWRGTDLYGMLFERLAFQDDISDSYNLLLDKAGLPKANFIENRKKHWELSYDKNAQAKFFTVFAGNYMGRNNKKGRTYDWPLNHLSDGHNQVTPRSFLALMINAAQYLPAPEHTVISAEGIRHGLREASKIRVEQLRLEFPWIGRVLLPLARLQVPCDPIQILNRWDETETIEAIRKMHQIQTFLLPFSSNRKDEVGQEMLATFRSIGVLTERDDGRYDMPDLFRVAARLLKKGGVSPEVKN